MGPIGNISMKDFQISDSPSMCKLAEASLCASLYMFRKTNHQGWMLNTLLFSSCKIWLVVPDVVCNITAMMKSIEIFGNKLLTENMESIQYFVRDIISIVLYDNNNKVNINEKYTRKLKHLLINKYRYNV